MMAIDPPICGYCKQPMELVPELEHPAPPGADYSYFRCVRHPNGDTAFRPKEKLVLVMRSQDGSLLADQPYPFKAASYEEAEELGEAVFRSHHAAKGEVHRVGYATPLLMWDQDSGWRRPAA